MGKVIGGFIFVVIVAVGLALLWETTKPIPDPVAQMAVVDTGVDEMKTLIEDTQRRIEAMSQNTQQQVTVIRTEVRARVEAMEPNDVAVGLQREIDLWRGSNPRSSRLDDADPRLLSGGASGARRTVRATGISTNQ